MVMTVSELLKAQSLTEQDKLKIIQEGKPRPVINNIVEYNEKRMSVNELYDQEMWLTACEQQNSIFCWTCLIFPLLKLNKCGLKYSEFKNYFIAKITNENLYTSVLEHKKSVCHISGFLKYRMFIKQNCLSETPKEEIIPSAIYLMKSDDKCHHEALKLTIDVACFLLMQAPPPVKATNGYDIFKSENWMETLNVLKEYDSSITDETIHLIAHSPTVLSDVIEGIANAIKRAIKKEIRSCSHVSLIFSAHSELEKCKLSTVLRYVHNGTVREVFIDFTSGKTVNCIISQIELIISEYEIPKLLSISFDGALPLPLLSGLINSLQMRYPFIFFVPCYFHDFSYVLEQRLSQFSECQLFFKSINSMKMFFQNRPEMCGVFNSVAKGKVFDLKNIKLSNSQFLKILKVHRREFVASFSHVVQNCEKYTKDDVTKAMGFLNILEEYQTIFLLETFYRLFDQVNILTEMLNSHFPEHAFNTDTVDNVKTVLSKEKAGGFEKLWTLVITEIIENCSRESLEGVGKKETNQLLDLFLKVLHNIIAEIQFRFKESNKLEFLSLLNCEAHCKLVISDYQMNQLQKMPDSLLEKDVINELKVLSKNGTQFRKKSVYEFLHILIKADLKKVFKNTYKLAEIILTLPCKPASPGNKGPSKLDIINDWAAISNESKMKLFRFLCIEKDYLEYLKTRSDFYDQVFMSKICLKKWK